MAHLFTPIAPYVLKGTRSMVVLPAGSIEGSILLGHGLFPFPLQGTWLVLIKFPTLKSSSVELQILFP